MNHSLRFVPRAASFLLLLAAAGCSSGAAAPAANGDAGRDLGQSQDTGVGQSRDTGAGGCAPRPDLAAAAPTCTTVVNSAAAVPFTPATGTAPTPGGGAILDGLYESTRTSAYGTTTGNGRRITFVISGGGTRMFWAGEVLDQAGTSVLASFRADTTISLSGTQINFTLSCSSTASSPIPAALDYTVSGQDLVLSLVNGNTVAATTYTRRGCAP
jgi:hypothetical protein